MQLNLTIPQRDIARQALDLLEKRLAAACKVLAECELSDVEAQTLLSRVAIVREELGKSAMEFTPEARLTARIALTFMQTQAMKVQKSELKLGIEPDSSDDRIRQIGSVIRVLGEQLDLVDAVFEGLHDKADEVFGKGLKEGDRVTISSRGRSTTVKGTAPAASH